MARLEERSTDSGHLNHTAQLAIFIGGGVPMLAALIGLFVLLVREKRAHKRKWADLEERCVIIQRAQSDADSSVKKPRAVLRRHTVLPFNSKTGWGTLPSSETINHTEPKSFPPHYAPEKPEGFVSKSSRLSWPFASRRGSGKAIRMRKIRVPILSTVIESPKPSPIVPVHNVPLNGDSWSPRRSISRRSSDQSLLSRHPAFRHLWQEEQSVEFNAKPELRRSLTAKPFSPAEIRVRQTRSRSVAEIPVRMKPGVMSRLPRPTIHARSASTCSQSSGKPPDVAMPPLPLEVARIKGEARRKSLLSRSPSRVSTSSYESGNSSILATHSSPIMQRSSNIRIQKVAKRDWRNSMISGSRPVRGPLTLHGTNQHSQWSIKSSIARFSSLHAQTTGNIKTIESAMLSKVSSPSSSPLTLRNPTTPCRRSGAHVTPFGSPEERLKGSTIVHGVSGSNVAPKRQLSEASTCASSTRSSNGNPFQWDPAPLSSGRPSALKGSPSARKGHRRQNCVRISLIPTTLGPPGRSPSPSTMNDIKEESPNALSEQCNIGLELSNTGCHSRPPSALTFNPELKLNTTTSIRASLTGSSPTLSMARYERHHTGTSFMNSASYVPTMPSDNYRFSTGSILTIPTFPSPSHTNIGSLGSIASAPPTFALSTLSCDYNFQARPPNTPLLPSSPFDILVPNSPSPKRTSFVEVYDPQHPQLVRQNLSSRLTKRFSSAFFRAIPEERSAASNDPMEYQRLCSDDSPPCSPKTVLSPFIPTQSLAAYNLPVMQTTIPEDPISTIDPAILTRDAFSTQNNSFEAGISMVKTPARSRSDMTIPTSTVSNHSIFMPLLEAAFPSSPPVAKGANDAGLSDPLNTVRPSILKPTTASIQSSPTSLYSSPSQSPCSSPPIPLCSPRPAHAQLPMPSLNWAHKPTLTPSPLGPRSSPPRPLRTSIQKLRRMNSDAEKGGRGERRYLRLGREESITLPGDESIFDELDASEDDGDRDGDEAKGHEPASDIPGDWTEEATILDLEEVEQEATPTAAPPSTSPKNAHADQRVNSTADKAEGKDEDKDTETRNFTFAPSTPSRTSSIWDDGEKFWTSTPPLHLGNGPRTSASPSLSSPPAVKSSPKPNSRKRQFEVARDSMPLQEDGGSPQTQASGLRTPDNKRSSAGSGGVGSGNGRGAGGRYRRKRPALGLGTPNVRIQVQPPSERGTPGSLYDADGFLRA